MGGFTSQTKKYFSALIIALASITLIAAFQNCGGPSAITFDSMSTLVDLPKEVPLETVPALPEIGLRTILQPTFYRTEKSLRDWAALTYQWYLNGRPMESQKSVQIILEPFQMKDVGVYQLEIKNEFTSVTSGSFTLTGSDVAKSLPESISITYSPNTYAPSKQVKGGPISLSLVEGGTNKDWGYFEYEWLKSSVPVPNAVGRTLTITNLQSADEGVYTLKMIDPQDRTKNRFSNSVALAIFDPSRQLPDEVQIEIKPNPAKVGDTVTLRARFPKDPHLSTQKAGMNPEQYYSFKWKCKQRTCASTAATATLDKIAMADAGNYQLTVSLLNNSGISMDIDPVELKINPLGCTADSDGNTGSRTVYSKASADSVAACNAAMVPQKRTCTPQDTWADWTPAVAVDPPPTNCTVAAPVEQPKACPNPDPNDGYGPSRDTYAVSSGDCLSGYKQQIRSCGTSGANNGKWGPWSPYVPEPAILHCDSQTPAKTCSGSGSRTVYAVSFARDCNAQDVKITQTGTCNPNTGNYGNWTPPAGIESPNCTTRIPCTDTDQKEYYETQTITAYSVSSSSNCAGAIIYPKRTCNTSYGRWGDWDRSYSTTCTAPISGSLTPIDTGCTIAGGASECTVQVRELIENIPAGATVWLVRTGDNSSSKLDYAIALNQSRLDRTDILYVPYGSNTFSLRQGSATGPQIGDSLTVKGLCVNNEWDGINKKCIQQITGTLTLNSQTTSCIIPVNENHCTVFASIRVENIPTVRAVWLGQQYRNVGGSLIYGGSQLTSGEPSYSNSNYQLQVKYGQNDFDLRTDSANGTPFGTNSAKATITGSCDQSSGASAWNYQTEKCEYTDKTAPVVTNWVNPNCLYRVYGNGSASGLSTRNEINAGRVPGYCTIEFDKTITLSSGTPSFKSSTNDVIVTELIKAGDKTLSFKFTRPTTATFLDVAFNIILPAGLVQDSSGNPSVETSLIVASKQDCMGYNAQLQPVNFWFMNRINTGVGSLTWELSGYTDSDFDKYSELTDFAMVGSGSVGTWNLPVKNGRALSSNVYLQSISSTDISSISYRINTNTSGQATFSLVKNSISILSFGWSFGTGHVNNSTPAPIHLITKDGKKAKIELPKFSSGAVDGSIVINGSTTQLFSNMERSRSASEGALFNIEETDSFRKVRAKLECN